MRNGCQSRINDFEKYPGCSKASVLSGRTLHRVVWRTGVDRRDLASTYVLHPLTIALSQISGNGVHRVCEGIPEYSGGDGEDGVD